MRRRWWSGRGMENWRIPARRDPAWGSISAAAPFRLVAGGYRSAMTDGSMTGRPYGGVNEKTSDVLPGERPNDDQDQVAARPEQEPRAAQGPMSDDVTRVPDGGAAE